MSLYKLKEWWSASHSSEQFADGALVVGNIDNAPEGTSKIVTGSLQGWLRIYDPQRARATGDSGVLLLEAKVDAPIYELEIGKVVSNCNALVILHSCKVVVCSCVACNLKSQGSNTETSHFELVFHYTHKFDSNAYSMCLGSFGSVDDHDMILVQSMDGHITVYEHDVFAVSSALFILIDLSFSL